MNLQPLTLAPVPLQFSDSMSCRRWVEQLTLSNAHRVHEVLTSQLSSLTAAELPPVERLKILETLRETVHFVQGETAKRYAGKGLPLEPAEMTAWSRVIALWQEAHNNYGQCLKAYREGDLSIAPHAALVTMRCLRLTGDTLTDYYRSYRQPPGRLWRSLHELYSFAEQQGFARIRIHDSFGRREPDSSCAEVYVQVVLAHLANPFSLSIRQMGFVERWVERWATMVGLAVQEPPARAIPLLAVDLHSERGPSFAANLSADANPRYLELEQLSKTLRQTISLLKQGQTPGQLGLGEDARQPGCENLLMLLYLQWCRAGTARDEERSPHEEAADVCFGLASAHGQLTTRPARTELSSREKQDLDTYGYVPRVNWEVDAAEPESSLERWLIVNQSVSGFMCIQREPTSRIRVHHNELIAVRRANGRHFHLGMAQWLRMDDNGVLCCGVRLFPGTPQAISVRPSNFNPVGGGRHERALLLPEVPAPSAPASIVLPAGWFQSGRFVEVYSDRKQVAKLLNVVEKGLDFDRGTIVIV
jgi:cyclic-di-GMP-binding protein